MAEKRRSLMDILRQFGSSLGFRSKQKESMKWFMTRMKKYLHGGINKKAFNPAKDPFVGGMFHYIYDPKLKDELPYWDKFPLVVPMAIYPDGFLGLNLHYLPPISRAKLLDYLIRLNAKYPTTKQYAAVSYYALKASATHSPLMKRTIKRYLSSHLRSNLVKIDFEEWENVVFLPTQDFQKATALEVWHDGNKKHGR